MDSKRYLFLLQISDSALPIGSFSHSFGLESYVLEGLITNENQAFEFMRSYILEPFLHNDLLTIKCIFEQSDLESTLALEHIIFAQSLSKEIREANTKLGRRFVKIISSALNDNNTWNLYAQNSINPTHASAFAFLCANIDIDYSLCIKHYAYTQVSSMVTNAIKLIPLSQYTGQNLLYKLHDCIELALCKLQNLDSSMLGICAPHYDIYTMRHEALYSRLYMS